MASVILEVLEYKREKINGTPMDRYKMKLKDGDNVHQTIGFRLAVPIMLKAGQLLENMRVVGELSQESFAREWYEAKNIEAEKFRRKDMVSKVEQIKKVVTKKVEDKMKPKIQAPEQLRLF